MSAPDTTVSLRPVATPLPLGFLGLFVATSVFASVQVGWIDPAQEHAVAWAVLALTVPVQALACVVGFWARDPVAGTGMGLLAGTWAAVALTTLTSPPGTSSDAAGVVLLASGGAMLVPTLGGRAKAVASAVMALSSVRFLVTGLAEISGSRGWETTAGCTGLLLAAVSLYAAFAFELEGTEGHAVLPLWRTGRTAAAVAGGGGAPPPGVRSQL